MFWRLRVHLCYEVCRRVIRVWEPYSLKNTAPYYFFWHDCPQYDFFAAIFRDMTKMGWTLGIYTNQECLKLNFFSLVRQYNPS